MLKEGESVTHRFDCNTVGPVPVASGYGSRTLTHSAAYVLEGSTHNTSSPSPQYEGSSPRTDRAPVVESTGSGIQITTFTGSTVSVIPRDQMVEANDFGAMPKSSHLTGSTTSVLPETKNSSVKSTYFTHSSSLYVYRIF